MENSNFKVYLGISIALVVLLILILIIPFSKKSTTNNQSPTTNLLTPTPIQTDSTDSTNSTVPAPVDFTGVTEEELPQAIVDSTSQKQELRSQLPLTLISFSINFDYAEDKFIVTLNEPKNQAKAEFESWRTSNYPGIEISQFNFQ